VCVCVWGVCGVCDCGEYMSVVSVSVGCVWSVCVSVV